MYLVRKYGGTSVATTEKIDAIASNIIETVNKNYNVVVVVSAMGKTTDHLIEMAQSIDPNAHGRELASLVSTGEQQTAALLSIALNAKGQEAISLTAMQAGILTTSNYQKGEIKSIEGKVIKSHLNNNKVVIITGFQGINHLGDITTLGRGGSDTSAVAIASCLKCPCEIYTDVDSIYTVDPRYYEKAKKISTISYDVMMEMASLGAGVLETRSVILAKKYKIPLILKQSLKNTGGTKIMESNGYLEHKPITGISINETIIMTTIESQFFSMNNLPTIFTILSDKNVNIDMITQTLNNKHLALSFSCSIDEKNELQSAIECLNETLPKLDIHTDTSLTKLSVVGLGMNSQSGVISKIFNVLKNDHINIYQITTSEISISITIDRNATKKAVHSLAEAFDL